MKKILCLIDNLCSGGAQRQMANLAVLLKQQKYDVEFVTYSEGLFFKDILDKADIPVHYIEANSYFKRIVRVSRYLKTSDADTVIAFLETPGFLACLAKALGGKWRLITTERSAKNSTFQGVRQRIFNYFEKRSDIKVCNSQNAMNMWKTHYPQYADKLRVIYNPVIMTELSSHCISNDNKLHMVVAASYQELKNPLGVIEALRILSEAEKSKLQIEWYGRQEVTIGDRTVYEEAQRRILEYGLENVIHLNADTDRIYDIMNNSDAVGLFSTVEGLPNAICEAMILGKPIVMTRVSDYTVLTEGNGILCDPDPESIAAALQTLLSLSPDMLADMGKISAKKAKSLFGADAITKQWIEIIEQK